MESLSSTLSDFGWFAFVIIAGTLCWLAKRSLEFDPMQLEHVQRSISAMDEAKKWLRKRGFELQPATVNDLRIYFGKPGIPLPEHYLHGLMVYVCEHPVGKHTDIDFKTNLVASAIHEIVEVACIKQFVGGPIPLVSVPFDIRQAAHAIAVEWESEYLKSRGYIFDPETKKYRKIKRLRVE